MENHVPEVEQEFVVRAVNAEKWGTAVELEPRDQRGLVRAQNEIPADPPLLLGALTVLFAPDQETFGRPGDPVMISARFGSKG
jgi:hypothetical protein